jgi:hypothetical protein
MESHRALHRAWDWIVFLLLIAASFHFARCYVTLSGTYLSLDKYADGTEQMPFQGRMLMMWPMHWANHNLALINFAAHHAASARRPDLIVIMAVSAFSVIGAGLTLTILYRQISSLQLFWWAPWALLLLISYTQYILHSDNNFLYPFDLPSLFFFIAGIALIYNRRFVLLLLMFPVAVLNRETALLLVPLLLIDGCCESECVQWKNLIRPALIGKATALLVIWATVVLFVHHRFRNNRQGTAFMLTWNLKEVLHPEHWPQLLSIGAFLLIPICVFVSDLKDLRLRMYLWIVPLWFGLMSVYGSLLETRVFGELGGLLGIAAALIFEQQVVRFASQHPEVRAL